MSLSPKNATLGDFAHMEEQSESSTLLVGLMRFSSRLGPINIEIVVRPLVYNHPKNNLDKKHVDGWQLRRAKQRGETEIFSRLSWMNLEMMICAPQKFNIANKKWPYLSISKRSQGFQTIILGIYVSFQGCFPQIFQWALRQVFTFWLRSGRIRHIPAVGWRGDVKLWTYTCFFPCQRGWFCRWWFQTLRDTVTHVSKLSNWFQTFCFSKKCSHSRKVAEQFPPNFGAYSFDFMLKAPSTVHKGWLP